MEIPGVSSLFGKFIGEKQVYYFSSTKLNSSEPHHFICIKRKDNDILILTVCSSQGEKIQKFIESSSLPSNTMVWISPKDDKNDFTKDTYINCNYSFTYTVEEFRKMYETGQLKPTGQITEGHYILILEGLHASPLIDEETKECLPNPDEIL